MVSTAELSAAPLPPIPASYGGLCTAWPDHSRAYNGVFEAERDARRQVEANPSLQFSPMALLTRRFKPESVGGGLILRIGLCV